MIEHDHLQDYDGHSVWNNLFVVLRNFAHRFFFHVGLFVIVLAGFFFVALAIAIVYNSVADSE